ncbi:MAG: winged helix-turn-helix transcriptional regulator [Anaerolineales bacterium]|uniref:ArsR/SmtB family transcription factor n=1 Tax=Candidatus Villigracilis vicinus TaxID=3140679 RepID=UPI003136170B|nr:winged helix-turn-helix transcriptional regulator [Anaerolineales bacterium]
MFMRSCEYKKEAMQINSLKLEVTQLQANMCSAFTDPTRILIIYVLHEKPCNVTELANLIGIPQPTASRHLKVLRDHGLVQTSRNGATITYSLVDDRLIQSLEILRTVLHDTITSKANLMIENS